MPLCCPVTLQIYCGVTLSTRRLIVFIQFACISKRKLSALCFWQQMCHFVIVALCQEPNLDGISFCSGWSWGCFGVVGDIIENGSTSVNFSSNLNLAMSVSLCGF